LYASIAYIHKMQRRAPALALLILLTGCFTGARPSFTTEPFATGSTSGDPSIDQVLKQLDAVNNGPYTATYTVLTKFGNATRSADVTVDTSRRSVTVGRVRFITINGASQTCELDKSDPCSTTLEPAKISDTQITPAFYAGDAAKRLRRSAIARIGTPIASVKTIAGQQATCVDVPVTGGVSVYCALAKGGPLASLDDGAVTITLTRFDPTIDETLFATTG
jgi:hypothetical protein